jgi:inositol-phosphate phosphatase / L-galactose 1-phosphate phosphatase / histidinol-phosphatase
MINPQPEMAPFLSAAHALADLTRPIARKYFRQPLAVQRKGDASPVTIADQEIETAMVAYLRQHFSEHGILGEEHGTHNAHAEWVWVLDPIDGTKSFITGRATFGTLIALAHHGKPVLGVIDQPITGERWVGCVGQPTTFNGTPCTVRTPVALSEAIAATTTPAQWTDAWPAHQALTSRTKSMIYGGDCYSYGMLALGFIDLVAEADLKPYDFMALAPVVQGAGGVITDWQGRALTIASDGRVLAATGQALLAEAVREMAVV